jgi:biopolymer transport protein ExbB/TolQ
MNSLTGYRPVFSLFAMLVLVCAAMSVSADWVRAQVEPDAQPSDAQQADDETDKATKAVTDGDEGSGDEGGTDSILAMVVDSGLTGMAFMGVLVLFSMVAGTIAVERSLNMRQQNVIPPAFIEAVTRACQDSPARHQLLNEACDGVSAPAATVLAAGMSRFGLPLVEVEKAMEDAAAREMAELKAKIRPLAMVGNVAPLVGLLGTVVGMILAFHTASQAGLGKAELLAKGIYMALLTTAGGLSIAIPSMMLAGFYGGRIDRFFRDLDRCLMGVLPYLVGQSVTPQTPSGGVAMPTSVAVPAAALSASPLPASPLPASPLPASPLPASPLPASPLPADASTTSPSTTSPSTAVPAAAPLPSQPDPPQDANRSQEEDPIDRAMRLAKENSEEKSAREDPPAQSDRSPYARR